METKFPPVVPIDTPTPWSAPNDFIARPRDVALGKFNPASQRPAPVDVRDRHRTAWLRGSINVTVGTVSALALSQPTSVRNMLILRNTSATANVFVEFGSDANTTTTPLRIEPNQVVLFDTVVPQDDIFVIGDAAGSLSISQSQYAP